MSSEYPYRGSITQTLLYALFVRISLHALRLSNVVLRNPCESRASILDPTETGYDKLSVISAPRGSEDRGKAGCEVGRMQQVRWSRSPVVPGGIIRIPISGNSSNASNTAEAADVFAAEQAHSRMNNL